MTRNTTAISRGAVLAKQTIAQNAKAAQAVPLLTEQEIDSVWDAIPQNQFWWRRYARAVEQAVRAKMGVAVPMTDEQAKAVIASTAQNQAKNVHDDSVVYKK